MYFLKGVEDNISKDIVGINNAMDDVRQAEEAARAAKRRPLLTRVPKTEQDIIADAIGQACKDEEKEPTAAAVRGVLLGETGLLHLGRRLSTGVPPQLERLGRLAALERLFLDDNQLTRLPEYLGDLHALYDLRVESNRLTELPASLGRLRSLIRLWCGDNLIARIPDSFAQLHALEKLQRELRGGTGGH